MEPSFAVTAISINNLWFTAANIKHQVMHLCIATQAATLGNGLLS
jgi:hypothetical protein